MCRLLAYGCRTRQAVADLLSPVELAGFVELSHLHRDGWGMTWLAGPDGDTPDTDGGRPVEGRLVEGRLRAERSVLPAYEDPDFDALIRRRLGKAGLVHLRWATSGLPVEEANTHPFLAGGWAFAHQGSIASPDRLDALLSPTWRARRRGTTDSERYFLYVLQCVEREGVLVEGVRRAASEIVAACGTASLNAVMLSPLALVVVHGRAGLEPPRDDLLAAVARAEDVPPEHLDAYFRLRYRQADGDLVVTSSGIGRRGWEDIPEDSILHFGLDTRSLSFHGLDERAGSEGTAAARRLR